MIFGRFIQDLVSFIHSTSLFYDHGGQAISHEAWIALTLRTVKLTLVLCSPCMNSDFDKIKTLPCKEGCGGWLLTDAPWGWHPWQRGRAHGWWRRLLLRRGWWIVDVRVLLIFHTLGHSTSVRPRHRIMCMRVLQYLIVRHWGSHLVTDSAVNLGDSLTVMRSTR